MQPSSSDHRRLTPQCFNPHRPRRADATMFRRFGHVVSLVSILTGPEGPMQQRVRSSASCRTPWFQSSPAPKGRCNHAVSAGQVSFLTVSILTGPEGPMQRWQSGPPGRPGRRFNPHRPRRADATVSSASSLNSLGFQSSPAPKGRCNRCSPGRTRYDRCFNPHRPRRADAT